MPRLILRLPLALLGCLVTLAPYSSLAAIRTANWVGGATGNYSDPANWDLGGADIPVNNATDTFVVNIPAPVTVNFDITGSGHQIDQLSLAAGSTLAINPGRDLAVVDSAAVAGLVTVNNSTFLADHAASTLAGNAARLQGSGGGALTHAAPSYDATGITSAAILSADGTATTLNLPNLDTITATNNPFGAHVRSVVATNFGTVDLPAMLTVHGPGGDDRFDFVATGGGTINFSSLNTLTGNVRFQTDAAVLNLNSVTSAENLTYSVPVAATVNLEALENQNGGTYNVPTGGTFNLPLLTTLENAVVTISDTAASFHAPLLTDVDNTRFALSGGAVHSLNVQPTYTLTNLVNVTVLSAEGPGTSLNASAVETIVATNNDFGANTRSFRATGGGVLDLSSLVTLNGPGGDDKVELITTSGGTINLDSLAATTGNVRFTSDSAIYTLPALANAGAITFDLNAAATLNLPELATQTGGGYAVPAAGRVNLPKLTSLHDATLTIADGGTFDAPLLTDIGGTTLTLGPGQMLITSALNSVDNARIFLSGGVTLAVADSAYANTAHVSGDLFTADGAGTLLDLESFTSFDSSQNPFGANRRSIRATASGTIDLSNVTTLAGPSGDDRLDVVTTTGGTIDLSNLQSITTGNVLFQSDAANFTLPALAQASAITFDLPDAATLHLPELVTQTGGGYDLPLAATFDLPKLATLTGGFITISESAANFNAPQLTNIDDTRVTLSGGAVFALNVGGYTANSLAGGNLMSVSGAGTTLDASTITTINSSTNPFGANVRTFSAANDAVLDLSQVQSVAAPSGDDRLDFVATAGGLLNMSSLKSIASGNSRFSATSGGRIQLGGVTASANMALEADGGTSSITAQYLHLNADASLSLTAGAPLKLTGSFSHELTNEAAFNADTGILQILGNGERLLEVAGADLGLVAAAGNFGLAQLIVGSESTTTQLLLVDLVDNGNRTSSEALYLLGSGGMDGLRILNGSILRIGDVPVYAHINGVITELHSLFAPDQTVIPYANSGSSGFIAIGDPPLDGDYNRNGIVDAADYTVWRDGLGTVFTPFHYQVWKANFGRVASEAAAARSAVQTAVPEPSATALLVALLTGWPPILWGSPRRVNHVRRLQN